MREVQATFPIGTVIQGHYCVEGVLGKGTSGAVYLVRDQRVKDDQDQLFVLKQLIDLNEQERHRLIFEDVLLRQLLHEALPRVYHVFVDDRPGWVYILMEYIEGPNLEALRQQQREKRFSWPDAISIMAPIIDAVGYLHRQQPPMIHRDIKPANIIVKAGTSVVLVDYGIVKKYDLDSATVHSCSPNYRAPELYSNSSNIRADIYGLGATFYTLVTGIAPADVLSRMIQWDDEGTDPLKPVNEVISTVPARVARAIYQAMSLNVHNRFSSVEQFWEALSSLVEQPSPPPSSMPSTSSSLPVVPKQGAARPAVVSVPKQLRVPHSWKPRALWPDAPKQAAARPAVVSAPKQPRAPHSWKLGPQWPPILKPAVEKPATTAVPKQLVVPSEEPAEAPPPEQMSLEPSTSSRTPIAPEEQPAEVSSLEQLLPAPVASSPPPTVSEEEPAGAPPPEQTSPVSSASFESSIVLEYEPVVSEDEQVDTSPMEPSFPALGSVPATPSRPPLKPEDEGTQAAASEPVLAEPGSSTSSASSRPSVLPEREQAQDSSPEPSSSVLDKQSIKGKRQKARRPYFVACALLLLLVCTVSSLFSLAEYQKYSVLYHDDLSLAREGIQHLQTGVVLLETLQRTPLDAPTVQKAQYELTAALMIFRRLESDLKSLPAISLSVPAYGARLSAALHLLPLVIEVSQTGVITCNTLDLLISRFHEPLNTQTQGLTMADLSVVDRNFQQVKTALNLIMSQVNHLQPGDLQFDPRLSKLVTAFHKDIPALQAWLDAAEKILPIAPTVLGVGTPTNYLIEVLDSTELRPGGGLIDSYGIATFSGGRLIAAPITDVDLLDNPFEAAGGQIPFPTAYTWFDLAPTWSFRDSNLDADFPTAARYGELTYKQEGGKVPIQGVIAITPAFIKHALDITGPIAVPEYHETVTSQNLVARIHYHRLGPAGEGPDTVLSPDGHSSKHKRFTELLADHFLARVRQLSSSALPKFLQLMISSLPSKDVQIYLNSSAAEHLLQSYHLDATIQSPGSDSLFVVDANIAANKASIFITNTLDDQVTVDGEGNTVHHTTLSYAWVLRGQNYGSPLYRDYLRIYVPPGSILHTQDGWEPRGMSEAFGREVWAGFFTLAFGQTRSITLVWTGHGAAKKGTGGWYYQYTIQRQAGIQWTLHLQVKLPPCAVKITELGGLVSSGPQVMKLAQSLSGDMNVGVKYTC